MNKIQLSLLRYVSHHEIRRVRRIPMIQRSALQQLVIEAVSCLGSSWRQAARECESEGRMFCFLYELDPRRANPTPVWELVPYSFVSY